MCIATLVFKRVDGNITSYKDVANLRAFSRLIDWLKFSTAIACWYVMMFSILCDVFDLTVPLLYHNQ